jgi:hypothetical protein
MFSSLSGNTIFYGNGTSGPYKLKDTHIFTSTDSVFINDSLIPGERYHFDYNQGSIMFDESIPESTKVVVRYKKLPYAVNAKYFNRLPETLATAKETLTSQIPVTSSVLEEPASDIEFQGSKTISVNIGTSQEVGLEQATRINLNGNLAGADVSAVLSDVGNPIPPEGTTKELSEFDKILISLKTDKFSALYGDNDLNQPIGKLGMVNKKVIGALFNGRLEKSSASAGYAKSKGIYKSLTFYGQDNNQGPYFLTINMNNAAIVPGSENIYLNSDKMTRGLSEDYTIDYSQGSVTFTNRRIINSFSRIQIDFEYSTEDYNRYLYFANLQYPISNLLLAAGVYSEADDKSENLVYALSDNDISYLSSVSAESSAVWLDGVKYVGQGNGDYSLVSNHYVYTGLDSGNYNVQFSYLGTGQGNYDYDNSISGFRYVGDGMGKYIPKIRIQLPEQKRIYNSYINYQTGFGLNMNLDGYFSQTYHNLFSNSASKNGFSYMLNSAYNKERIKLSYLRTQLSSKFIFPGTYNIIDFSYRWAGINQESLKNRDELDLITQPFNFLKVFGGAGWISSWSNNSRKRFYFGGEILRNYDNTWVNYNIEYYPDLLTRYSASLTPQYKTFLPRLDLFWNKEENNNQQYITPSLQVKIGEGFDLDLSADFKEVDNTSKKSNQIYKIETNFNKTNYTLNGAIGYTRNRLNNIQTNADFFGNLTSQISIIQGLNLSIDFLEQQSQAQTTEINYVWVGLGQGQYKRNPETGQYYFDPKGDYIQELIPSGNFINSKTRNLQTNWSFYKFQFISFDGYYTLNNQFTTSQNLQSVNNRQLDFSILPYQKSFSVRLVNTYDFSKDNQYNTNPMQLTNDNYRVEINSQRLENIPFILSGEINNKTNERLNIGIQEKRIDRTLTFTPTLGFGLNLKTVLSYRQSQIQEPLYYPDLSSFSLYTQKLSLERIWEIEKSTNLDLNVSFTNRTTNLEQLPFDINLYEPKGFTPEVRLSLDRIFQTEVTKTFNQLILNASYSFLKYPLREAEHNFSVKIQANF